MELKHSRDYRKFGSTIDEYIKSVSEMKYGFYTVTLEQKKILAVIEGMYFLQMNLNKGVRLLGGWDGEEHQVEIFDFKKREEEIENSLYGFKL